ncbi:tRNA lysidine(34) synthetase TilS [Flavobacterium wongokense]|uniref:tRNA lysidine(34) synthetase TilS n=1 Tax=Flavobacterium wongokense TaxID=2910674 RepID=UPI001F1CD2F1|nr:tRNA lysidine(34) synthetase TilS [Flavobacterium sp. WG47]MCF6133397.1 tRNA lysidine(34) synthetase TilS [Flavobacterium sp. WG47]
MLQKFQNHISANFPFLQGRKLLLATSGGIDSMVLLHLCQQSGLDVRAAHCNFQLRGEESDADEAFVKSECEKLGVLLFVAHFDTKKFSEEHKLSIQVTARTLRYDWFQTLLINNDYDYILTAHHLDDSLETFLINFTRASGLDGLTGIPKQNGYIIRPLLAFSRNEIEDFAHKNNIKWREDSSNASDKYLRNKLRHDVIPILKELNPSLLSSFESTISNLQQAQTMVDDASRIVYRKVVSDINFQKRINLPELMQLPNYQAYLYQWLEPFGFSDWPSVNELVHAQSGKQIHSQKHTLLKDREELIVFERKVQETESFLIEKDQKDVKFPLKLSFCNVDDISVQTTNTIFVDQEKLQFPLQIRKWEEGDFLYPFGMTGKKKLGKFFKDEKFSLIDKSEAWLLCSDNQIVWVIGKRQDDRFKVTQQTTQILQIQLQE